jgi:uncharacterized protein (TIGR02646 family)
MIPLNRDRSPDKIHNNFHEAKRKEFETELLNNQKRILNGEIDKHPYDSERWKPAKDQLSSETEEKCAYCEAPTRHVAYGDVEHYRPKKIYWWLMYCYDNYLVSCTLCNQKYKKAKFPLKNTQLKEPVIKKDITNAEIDALAGTLAPDPLSQKDAKDFEDLHNQERPFLLNPYFDKPADYLAYRADQYLREVELIPLSSNSEAKDFCEAAEENYGLNRQLLKEYRWAEYKKYFALRSCVNDPGISQFNKDMASHTIKEMKSRKAPYSAMIIYFDSLPLEELPVPIITT